MSSSEALLTDYTVSLGAVDFVSYWDSLVLPQRVDVKCVRHLLPVSELSSADPLPLVKLSTFSLLLISSRTLPAVTFWLCVVYFA